MPSLPAKRKILLIQAKALEKQKLNPSRSARFHMKTRVSLIFCEWLYVMLFSFLSRSSKLCDLKLLCFTTESINGEDNIKLKPRFNRVIDCCLFIVLKKRLRYHFLLKRIPGIIWKILRTTCRSWEQWFIIIFR